MYQIKFYLLVVFASIFATSNGQEASAIHFNDKNRWDAVLKEASISGKYIFVDCYATWCIPCKKMEKEVFSVDSVGDFFNQHFISVKFQMDTSAKDNDIIKSRYADANDIATAYNVFGYPTALFFSPEGRLVHEGFGAYGAADFIALARNALNPEKQYFTLLEKFREGLLPFDRMPGLAEKAASLQQSKLADSVAARYINDHLLTLAATSLFTRDNILFISQHIHTSKDKGFKFFRQHLNSVDTAMKTKGFCFSTLDPIIEREVANPEIDNTNKPNWGHIYGLIKNKYDTGFANRVVLWARIKWLESKSQWDEYCKYVIEKVQHYGAYVKVFPYSAYNEFDRQSLNFCAWDIFTHSGDSNQLKTALGWSNIVLHSDTAYNAGYTDTYANLLYKLGRKNEALVAEEEAISKAQPFEKAELQSNLDKMKNGQPTWEEPKDVQVYSVNSKQIKAQVPSTLWGLFFEDINRGADGGVYAELVKNRSFDFPKPMTGWETWPKPRVRDGVFTNTDEMDVYAKDPKFMAVSTEATDTVGLVNTGYDGMVFKKGLPYTFTLRYKQVLPGVHVRIFLFSSSKPIAQESMQLNSNVGTWQEQQVSVTPDDTAVNGKLLVIFEGAGKLDVDRISLFPTDTWKHKPGGLRNDLVQKLADLKPGFLRFPGGCIVEGNQLVHRYQWKNTVGPLEDRLLVQSIWADDVPARQTPDYMETFGLGFLEYFELCEDIGAAPLPIINCGMSCQFDAAEVVPLSQLKPFIQDALDLIEFANGDTTTVWGKKRAQYGHSAPFNMQLLGVGNENWGPQYAERLALFTEAIKAKYPYVKIVGATGYSRNEPVFKYMDSVLRARHADIIDEHFYSTPEWFYANSNRYDSYDRKGPKIFVGEYAAQSDHIGSMDNKNNLKTALSEAAFMTGIERNADVVSMSSYAPLFAHVTGWQWTPNLIWFDNSSSYNTPNYYVQQMFSLNKGTDVVPVTLDGKSIQGQDSIWASAVTDKNTHELIIKIVNANPSPRQKTIVLDDQKNGGGIITTLSGGLDQMNSLEKPGMIRPVAEPIAVTKGKLELTLKPYSMNVIRITME